MTVYQCIGEEVKYTLYMNSNKFFKFPFSFLFQNSPYLKGLLCAMSTIVNKLL